MTAKPLLLVFSIALLGLFSVDSRSDGFYAEVAYASNAGATDRNLGRNFAQIGWDFGKGVVISGGTYFAGEEHCFGSLTLGRKLAQGRWQVSLTAHEGGICSVDSRQVPFESNLGFYGTRLLQARPRWSVGIGGCLWEHADYAVGDLAIPENPLSTIDDGLQLTAQFLLRFKLMRDSSE